MEGPVQYVGCDHGRRAYREYGARLPGLDPEHGRRRGHVRRTLLEQGPHRVPAAAGGGPGPQPVVQQMRYGDDGRLPQRVPGPGGQRLTVGGRPQGPEDLVAGPHGDREAFGEPCVRGPVHHVAARPQRGEETALGEFGHPPARYPAAQDRQPAQRVGGVRGRRVRQDVRLGVLDGDRAAHQRGQRQSEPRQITERHVGRRLGGRRRTGTGDGRPQESDQLAPLDPRGPGEQGGRHLVGGLGERGRDPLGATPQHHGRRPGAIRRAEHARGARRGRVDAGRDEDPPPCLQGLALVEHPGPAHRHVRAARRPQHLDHVRPDHPDGLPQRGRTTAVRVGCIRRGGGPGGESCMPQVSPMRGGLRPRGS